MSLWLGERSRAHYPGELLPSSPVEKYLQSGDAEAVALGAF
jgi:hypothetical protein